ncbi:MAG TPA: alpha/beta fold hydrolase [Casimicrobiaceae bacterium]|nr:alpha/beta fold hydrolase [Casimicrobiaceae bacterium]
MNATLASPVNSTIVRFTRPAWAVFRAYFAVASRLLPDLARRHAERLFTTPPRYAGRNNYAADARRETVVAGKHSLPVWQAGPPGAAGVLLVHGWGGRGVQMGSFVAPLLAKGFRVVWFDHPGHGESGRAAVALPDFVRALEAIALTHGPFAAAIGHSLGAAAIGVALRRGVRLGRVAFVSAPASITEHTRNFARWLGITPTIREALRSRLERRYGLRFAEIDRIADLEQLRLPALFVHDASDTEVPFEHAIRLSGHLPGARLVKTYGLGHNRILRDRAVVEVIVDFVSGRDHNLPTEVPVLPRPAPIY